LRHGDAVGHHFLVVEAERVAPRIFLDVVDRRIASEAFDGDGRQRDGEAALSGQVEMTLGTRHGEGPLGIAALAVLVRDDDADLFGAPRAWRGNGNGRRQRDGSQRQQDRCGGQLESLHDLSLRNERY